MHGNQRLRRPWAGLVGLAALLLVSAACSDQKLELPAGGGGFGGFDVLLGDSDQEPVTWSAGVSAIFAARCAACHSAGRTGTQREGAPAHVNFDTYEDAVEHADRAWTRIAAGTMPPGRDFENVVPSAERGVIRRWMDGGMPP